MYIYTMILYENLNWKLEFVVGIIYFLLLSYLLSLFLKKNQLFIKKFDEHILKLAILVRLMASIGFGLIHIKRYRYPTTISDTENYHLFSTYYLSYLEKHHSFQDIFGGNPIDFLSYLTSNHISTLWRDSFAREAQLFIVRIGALINLISFNSFIAKSLVFGAIGFIGLIYILKTFQFLFGKYDSLYFIIPLLFMPSIVFWTNGYMKEPICIFCIGMILNYVVRFVKSKELSLSSILIFLLLLGVLAIVKVFLFILMILFILIYSILNKIYLIPFNLKNVLRISPIILTITMLLMQFLNSPRMGKYTLNTIIQRATASYSTIKNSTKAGSEYEACLQGNSFSDILVSIPHAIGTSLFRPYIWECNNLLSFFSAFESFCILLLTFFAIYFLIKNKTFYMLFDYPFILSILFISLIYLYFVAVSSSNFGTLVRYKSILSFFYTLTLSIIIARNLEMKNSIRIE